MNDKYKTFEELKEEFGEDYEHKFYEMGLSAVKEIERLIKELQRKDNIINDAIKLCEENAEAIYEYEGAYYDMFEEIRDVLQCKEKEDDK